MISVGQTCLQAFSKSGFGRNKIIVWSFFFKALVAKTANLQKIPFSWHIMASEDYAKEVTAKRDMQRFDLIHMIQVLLFFLVCFCPPNCHFAKFDPPAYEKCCPVTNVGDSVLWQWQFIRMRRMWVLFYALDLTYLFTLPLLPVDFIKKKKQKKKTGPFYVTASWIQWCPPLLGRQNCVILCWLCSNKHFCSRHTLNENKRWLLHLQFSECLQMNFPLNALLNRWSTMWIAFLKLSSFTTAFWKITAGLWSSLNQVSSLELICLSHINSCRSNSFAV